MMIQRISLQMIISINKLQTFFLKSTCVNEFVPNLETIKFRLEPYAINNALKIMGNYKLESNLVFFTCVTQKFLDFVELSCSPLKMNLNRYSAADCVGV